MKLKDCVSKHSTSVAVTLSGITDGITLVGATVPTSFSPGGNGHILTAYLPAEKDNGILVISALWNDKPLGFLLLVRRSKENGEDVVTVDIGNSWQPPVPASVDGYTVRVMVGDEWFSTCSTEMHRKSGDRYIADVGLVLRYLEDPSDENATAIRATATEAEMEQTELERAYAEIKRLRHQTKHARVFLVEFIQKEDISALKKLFKSRWFWLGKHPLLLALENLKKDIGKMAGYLTPTD